MKQILVFGLAVASFAMAGVVMAYPTLTGPTGQAVIPTAAIAPAGLSIAADWAQLEEGESLPIRAVLAFGPSLEVGAMYDPLSDDAAVGGVALDRVVGANAKFKAGPLFGGDVALGAQFRREEDILDQQTDYSQAYLAWSTRFDSDYSDTSNMALTLGVNWTRVEPDTGVREEGARGFAGIRLQITDSIALLGDYQTQRSNLGDADPITSATVRFTLTPNIMAQVGTTNAFGFIATPDHNVFAGLTFIFGRSEE